MCLKVFYGMYWGYLNAINKNKTTTGRAARKVMILTHSPAASACGLIKAGRPAAARAFLYEEVIKPRKEHSAKMQAELQDLYPPPAGLEQTLEVLHGPQSEEIA